MLPVIVPLLLLIAASEIAEGNNEELSGHQIWVIKFETSPSPSTIRSFRAWEEDALIDIFTLSNEEMIFLVSPNYIEEVRTLLEDLGFDIIVQEDDVPNLLENLRVETEIQAKMKSIQACTEISCDVLPAAAYMTFEEIETYLKSVANANPSRVNLTSIGQTVEERDIWMVTIRSDTVPSDRAIFVEGGIHAREWISPAVTLYLIDMLIKDSNIGSGVEFKIVPVTNPDGYVYTHTTNRFWRKNRYHHPDLSCPGVDLNRNWDFQWGGTGSSSSSCSQVYRGESPFSEKETEALSTAMLNTENVKLVLAIHSYGQLMLYPWGYTTEVEAPNTEGLKAMAGEFVKIVRRINGIWYTAMNSADLYPAAGATEDWAYGVLKATYVFTLELRDRGYYGFILPPNQIDPTRKEIWRGFKYLICKIQSLSA